jgi:hypothetical protein
MSVRNVPDEWVWWELLTQQGAAKHEQSLTLS